MSAHFVAERSYHERMHSDGLPHPSEALTLTEIQQRLEHVLDVLEQGGAILVYTDDLEHRLGVLTCEQPLLDEASIAAQIDSGHLPPIAELIAMDDRGETP